MHVYVNNNYWTKQFSEAEGKANRNVKNVLRYVKFEKENCKNTFICCFFVVITDVYARFFYCLCRQCPFAMTANVYNLMSQRWQSYVCEQNNENNICDHTSSARVLLAIQISLTNANANNNRHIKYATFLIHI